MATKKAAAVKPTYSAPFIFGRINFMLMIGGFLVMVIGMVLMTGGAPKDPSIFNAAEKYSFVRISLAPIVILTGLGIEIAAILIKPKD